MGINRLPLESSPESEGIKTKNELVKVVSPSSLKAALNQKGLRPSCAASERSAFSLESSPESEGIKTDEVRSSGFLQTLESSPESEGIKTTDNG